jgi:hypothetical protein
VRVRSSILQGTGKCLVGEELGILVVAGVEVLGAGRSRSVTAGAEQFLEQAAAR